MHFITHLPLYFVWGLMALWHYGLYIPHPSWHKLIEAFVTGLIIKLGYFTAHHLLRLERPRKRSKAGLSSPVASGMSELVEN